MNRLESSDVNVTVQVNYINQTKFTILLIVQSHKCRYYSANIVA